MSYEVDPVFGCHLSTGRLDRDGYAFHGSSRAHIVAWVAVNGAVPDGLVLDHLCRNRACCAPHHLEAVTQSENERRKMWAYRARRKVCPKGHDLRALRVVTKGGGIVCRQCNRDAMGEGGVT